MFIAFLVCAVVLAALNFTIGLRKLTWSKNRLIQNGETWWRTIHPFMPKLAGFIEVVFGVGLLAPALVLARIPEFSLMIVATSAAFASLLAQLLAVAVLNVHRMRVSRTPHLLMALLALVATVLGVIELLIPTFH